MKKQVLWVMLTAIMLVLAMACALGEETAVNPEEETIATASIGDVTFSFTNEQEFFDVCYKYPDEFELEINEEPDRVRHLVRYHVEGFEPTAVGLVVARNNYYATPEERLKDVAFLDTFDSEEINGVTWAIGSKSDTSNGSVIIYACAAGGYVYTFSFSSDYPDDFDYAEFARTFAGEVTIQPAND